MICPMRRRIPAIVALLVACASLTACYMGPDPVQYAALASINGHPTAVIAACGRPHIRVVFYLDDNANDPNGDLNEWEVIVTPPSPLREMEAELFGAPRPGWDVEPDRTVDGGGVPPFKVKQLTSLQPGHLYALGSSDGGPE